MATTSDLKVKALELAVAITVAQIDKVGSWPMDSILPLVHNLADDFLEYMKTPRVTLASDVKSGDAAKTTRTE